MVKQNIKIIDNLKFPYTFTPDDSNDELVILWNIGELTHVKLDGNEIELERNCVLFVSEFYMNLQVQYGLFRAIIFNKTFLSPVDNGVNACAYLMIFYGLHAINHLPKVIINKNDLNSFEIIWKDILSEINILNNPFSIALLRNSLERFLLLFERNHEQSAYDIPINLKDLRLIKEFQYLVNTNFKELTKVSDYANILEISPKKISEIFGFYYSKKASELIADRRNLYAKRRLMYTDELIKNIAYNLNFSDSQAFSHFFKKQNGITPHDFRSRFKS